MGRRRKKKTCELCGLLTSPNSGGDYLWGREDAERRAAAGEVQVQCRACRRWRWESEVEGKDVRDVKLEALPETMRLVLQDLARTDEAEAHAVADAYQAGDDVLRAGLLEMSRGQQL